MALDWGGNGVRCLLSYLRTQIIGPEVCITMTGDYELTQSSLDGKVTLRDFYGHGESLSFGSSLFLAGTYFRRGQGTLRKMQQKIREFDDVINALFGFLGSKTPFIW